MIDEPGSFSGSDSSPSPERGPEPRKRMSLAILKRLAATVLIAPCENTIASCAASASNLFGAEVNFRPVIAAIRSATASANPAGALSPVPTAVPPCASSHQHRQRLLDAVDAVLDLLGVAGEFLAERERRRVLGVGAADLDDLRPLPAPCRSSAFRSFCSAGISRCTISSAAAMCIAVGKVSFDDWLMLTWSLGWTGVFEPSSPPSISMARFEITSLAFMFDCVPEPVCQTTSGKCCVELALDHFLRPPATIALPIFGSSRPRSMFTSAAARLTMPSARTIGCGMRLAADLEIARTSAGSARPIAVGRHLDRAERVGLPPASSWWPNAPAGNAIACPWTAGSWRGEPGRIDFRGKRPEAHGRLKPAFRPTRTGRPDPVAGVPLDLIRPFRALRPAPGRAAEVLAPPYDVLSSDEARVQARGKPWSFLHISKPEIDLLPTSIPIPTQSTPRRRRTSTAWSMRAFSSATPNPPTTSTGSTREGRAQTGLAAVASLADYRENRVRKHELTTP